MAGEGQKVHAQVLHIDLDVGDALGAVGDDHDVALAVAEGGGRLHVVLPAEDVGHLGHGDEPGFVGDRFLQGFQRDLALGVTFQELQGRAVPLGGLEPGEKVAVVLHDGDDHFVAGLEQQLGQAVGGQVQALAGVAGEDDLTGAFRVDELGNGLAGGLIALRGPLGQVVDAPEGVGVVVAVKLTHGVQNSVRLLGGGGVVQVDHGVVAEEGKVLANLQDLLCFNAFIHRRSLLPILAPPAGGWPRRGCARRPGGCGPWP